MYKIEYSEKVEDDIYKHKKYGNKKLLKKINQFINELELHPRAGTGQVERLKYFTEREVYSRRIDKEHRLVYEIKEQQIIVLLISAFGHY